MFSIDEDGTLRSNIPFYSLREVETAPAMKIQVDDMHPRKLLSWIIVVENMLKEMKRNYIECRESGIDRTFKMEIILDEQCKAVIEEEG